MESESLTNFINITFTQKHEINTQCRGSFQRLFVERVCCYFISQLAVQVTIKLNVQSYSATDLLEMCALSSTITTWHRACIKALFFTEWFKAQPVLNMYQLFMAD